MSALAMGWYQKIQFKNTLISIKTENCLFCVVSVILGCFQLLFLLIHPNTEIAIFRNLKISRDFLRLFRQKSFIFENNKEILSFPLAYKGFLIFLDKPTDFLKAAHRQILFFLRILCKKYRFLTFFLAR